MKVEDSTEANAVMTRDIQPLLINDINAAATPQTGESSDPELFTAPTLTAAVDHALEQLRLQLNRDPRAAHDFVRRGTAFESYTGVLKGAHGTFLTRAGNSADRSLLLAELIQGKGEQSNVRFAYCATGSAVPGSAAIKKTTSRPVSFSDLRSHVTDPDLSLGVRWLEGALTIAREDALLVQKQLSAAVEPAMETILESRRTVDVGETVHIWPQVDLGGVWTNLDPDSATGEPPCSPTMMSSEIPEKLFHRLSLTVIVETLKDGTLHESVALRVDKRTSEIAAAQILFSFGEASGLLTPRVESSDGLAWYTPVVRIDQENTVGEGFALPKLRAASAGPQDVSGGFADVLGGDFYGGPDGITAPPVEVMSAWLQIELSSPERSMAKARTEVFDRLGMAIRSNTGDSTFELLPLDVVDGEYAALASMWQVGFIVGEIAAPETLLQVSRDVSTLDGVSAVLDQLARAFPTVRRELGGLPAAPMVLLIGLVPSANASGEVGARLVFDLLHIATRPPSDAATASREAVSSPFAEYVLAALVGANSESTDGVAKIMSSAVAASIPLQIVEPGRRASVEGASTNALARMNSRTKQGYVLATTARAVGPQESQVTAWWYVDPSTGIIQDEHENGRSTATVDRAVSEKDTPSTMARVRAFACKVAKPVVIGASAIYLLSGGVMGLDALKFVAKVQEGYQKQRAVADKALMIACGDRQRLGGAGSPPPPQP
jgi:hypothetical protein